VKSGSLITARAALDQGREVMAVPGHPLEPRASGCNQLLRDGAVLVRRAEDVLEALGPAVEVPDQRPLPLDPPSATPTQGASDTAPTEARPPSPPADKRSLRETAQLHSAILKRLSPVPLAEDQLLRDLAAPPGHIAPALTDLEMDGKVIRHPGGLVSRAPAP
jgi:DNA processing protein